LAFLHALFSIAVTPQCSDDHDLTETLLSIPVRTFTGTRKYTAFKIRRAPDDPFFASSALYIRTRSAVVAGHRSEFTRTRRLRWQHRVSACVGGGEKLVHFGGRMWTGGVVTLRSSW